MNIKQAKNLKVGDEMMCVIAIAGTTKGKAYPLINSMSRSVCFIDDWGHTQCLPHANIAELFELSIASTRTEWIPFDADRMGEAKGYRQNGLLISCVTLMDNSDVVYVASNKSTVVTSKHHCHIQMQVEVKVRYPCLCWVSDTDASLRNLRRVIDGHDTSKAWSYTSDSIGWKYATPLTPSELAEIGLQKLVK